MQRIRLILLWPLITISVLEIYAQDVISVTQQATIPSTLFSLFIGEDAVYGVETYKILYTSSDLLGNTDTLSGLFTLPLAADIGSPLIIVQHGTVSSRDDVPSRLGGGYELGAGFSSMGYISIQPDYLGLGDSEGLHPYLHAETEAQAAVDMLFAVKNYLSDQYIAFNDQLFITGYSQGGHAGMAAHRLLEEKYADEIFVTAAAHLSGPYSISNVVKQRLLSDIPYYYPGYAAWTVLSYNEAYGLYDSLEQYFKPFYADLARQFYNEDITLDELQVRIIDQLTMDYGSPITRFIFQDSIISAISTHEEHPLNVALQANDTYDWAPYAPTRLFYCTGDDQVPFLNSIIADSVMNVKGALDVLSMDVDTDADHRGCILPAGLATIEFFKLFANFNATSTWELAANTGMSAFPNPASLWVQIDDVPEESYLNISDINGIMVHTQSLNAGTNVIHTDLLTRGMYLFQVLGSFGIHSIPIIIHN